ncbi:SET domain-containing protein, partial [Rhizodiscina lignyota]
MLHQRKIFRPCDHEGPCEAAQCSCYKEGVQCEKTCACSARCRRRYRGCKCAQKGKPCSTKTKCPCKELNRECDPDLCSTCGAIDVLDPVNRYDDDVVNGRCHNVFVQRNRPKHTKIGISQISGCGLYACEDIKTGEYISEYKGEICSHGEAERRGVLYSYRTNNYLFTVNPDVFDIDSMRYGNKTRFINNSEIDANINVYAQLLFCNTVVRIGMFAKKDIKAGDELFFNYG